MLWTCKSWWARMPSTNPPRPTPRSSAAASNGLEFAAPSWPRPPAPSGPPVDQGGHAEEDREGGECRQEVGPEAGPEDPLAHLPTRLRTANQAGACRARGQDDEGRERETSGS